MNEIKVDVVRPEVSQRLVDKIFDVFRGFSEERRQLKSEIRIIIGVLPIIPNKVIKLNNYYQ